MDNGKSWWVTLIEGVVAIILGVYLLFGGDAAANNVFLVAALYLLLTGIISIFRGTRGTVARWQAIIAIVVGALFLLFYAIGTMGAWGYTIVAIGAIIVGALGLYAAFFARSGREFAWGPVLTNGLLLLLGILILFVDINLQFWTALILIALGVIMILWGWFGRDDEEEPEPEEATSEAISEMVDDLKDEAADSEGED